MDCSSSANGPYDSVGARRSILKFILEVPTMPLPLLALVGIIKIVSDEGKIRLSSPGGGPEEELLLGLTKIGVPIAINQVHSGILNVHAGKDALAKWNSRLKIKFVMASAYRRSKGKGNQTGFHLHKLNLPFSDGETWPTLSAGPHSGGGFGLFSRFLVVVVVVVYLTDQMKWQRMLPPVDLDRWKWIDNLL